MFAFSEELEISVKSKCELKGVECCNGALCDRRSSLSLWLIHHDQDIAKPNQEEQLQVAVLHSDWKSVKLVLLNLLSMNPKYKES